MGATSSKERVVCFLCILFVFYFQIVSGIPLFIVVVLVQFHKKYHVYANGLRKIFLFVREWVTNSKTFWLRLGIFFGILVTLECGTLIERSVFFSMLFQCHKAILVSINTHCYRKKCSWYISYFLFSCVLSFIRFNQLWLSVRKFFQFVLGLFLY